MLKFTDFVTVVQKAVGQAAQSVSQHNIALFTTYFKSKSGNDLSKNPLDLQEGDVLTPKTVAMEYSRDTSNGPVPHQVQVPLLSLAPISYMQPSQIEFEIDLECLEKDGEMMISFPAVKRNLLGQEKVSDSTPNAKLTMRIDVTSRPPGVAAVIEGYDKNLRAQIPN
ncbi:MAG: hypothetical protein RLY90_524 [Pseudomonadota bacterium]